MPVKWNYTIPFLSVCRWYSPLYNHLSTTTKKHALRFENSQSVALCCFVNIPYNATIMNRYVASVGAYC